MRFAYDGFLQANGQRQNFFYGLTAGQPNREFCFTIDLALLGKNRISFQEIPHLCAQLLGEAEAVSEGALSSYEHYVVSQQDLVTFTAPRRAQEAERDKRRNMQRKVRPKPMAASQHAAI